MWRTSRVSLTKRSAQVVNDSQIWGTDALEDPAGRAERLLDWRQDPRAPVEEKDWPGRLGKHTGLWPALISKIERGRLFPTRVGCYAVFVQEIGRRVLEPNRFI